MDVPPLVVVDTSVAVEALIAESEMHADYDGLLRVLRAAGCRFAYNELLEAELIEAAYTWDARRERAHDWRSRRRTHGLPRGSARVRSVLAGWRGLVDDEPGLVIPVGVVVDAALAYVTERGLGSYDAVHLATARLMDCPIVTHDRMLARAAEPETKVISRRRAAP